MHKRFLRVPSRQAGFTLIDFLAVIAILGIIASMIFPSLIKASDTDYSLEKFGFDVTKLGPEERVALTALTYSELRRMEEECEKLTKTRTELFQSLKTTTDKTKIESSLENYRNIHSFQSACWDEYEKTEKFLLKYDMLKFNTEQAP